MLQETQEKRVHDQRTTINVDDNREENDHRQEYYSEKRYHRTERETRHRSPSETSEKISEHGIIDEEFKKKYLRCLAYMKLIERLYDNQRESDDEQSRRVGLFHCMTMEQI